MTDPSSTKIRHVLRESLDSWLLLLTTVVFFALTLLYATNTIPLQDYHTASSSRSRAVALLNILSQITGFFLAAIMTIAIDTTRWLLMSRGEGLMLSDFLGMQSNASPWALLTLICGRGTRITARGWSLLRLLATLLVPLLSIVLLRMWFLGLILAPVSLTITSGRRHEDSLQPRQRFPSSVLSQHPTLQRYCRCKSATGMDN